MPTAKMVINIMDYFHFCLIQVRTKILGKLPEDTKGPLTKLHTSLNGKVEWSKNLWVQIFCSADTMLINNWHTW